jgi:hypothetical protein
MNEGEKIPTCLLGAVETKLNYPQVEPVTTEHSGSKYMRSIKLTNGKVDVYAVLLAFDVSCPASQHAIKKLLCAGLRGKGSRLQDLREARDAITRAIELEQV